MRMTDANNVPSHQDRPFDCPLCGEPLPAGAVECTQCDWVKGYEEREPVTSGSARDLTAAVLSLIPGLGHIFKGHLKMGIGYMAGTLLAAFVFGPLGMVGMGFQLFLLPFYWLWVAVHAFMIPDLKPDRYIPSRIG